MRRRDFIKVGSAALAGLSAFPLDWVCGAEAAKTKDAKTKKVLYFTACAGFVHSPVNRKGDRLSHSEKVFTEMGKWAGYEVECTKDGAVFDGSLDAYDVIAFYTSGDLTKKNKDNPQPMSPAGKGKLLDAVAAGKGFVGFHSATDTFHSAGKRNETQTEVDPYLAMLGGEFVSHDAQQEASLLIVSHFPGVGGLGCAEGLSFYEEWYALKNFAKDLHVILVQETDKMAGPSYQRPSFPCTWARMHGKGRVFYTSLGHREDVWTNPFFQAIVQGGMAWAMGKVNAGVKPNLDQVTPHASQLPAAKA